MDWAGALLTSKEAPLKIQHITTLHAGHLHEQQKKRCYESRAKKKKKEYCAGQETVYHLLMALFMNWPLIRIFSFKSSHWASKIKLGVKNYFYAVQGWSNKVIL